MKTILSEYDLEIGRVLFEKEKVFPVTRETMFCAGVKCIISAVEKYRKYEKVYEILKAEFNTPARMIGRRNELKEIVRRLRFPNRKFKFLVDFAGWYSRTDIPEKIIEDIKLGRRNEFKLRDRIAREAPGIWYKGASFFMNKCGYENVVSIDLHVLRFLRDLGYKVKIPDYKKRSGPKPKEYLAYEKTISQIARMHSVSPALFQFAIWAKYSGWNRKI